MPNIKSAAKRVKTSAVAHQRNVDVKTELKSIRRDFFLAVEKKEKDQAERLFRVYSSALDKASKKGVIKRNTAIRRKARGAEKIRVSIS